LIWQIFGTARIGQMTFNQLANGTISMTTLLATDVEYGAHTGFAPNAMISILVPNISI